MSTFGLFCLEDCTLSKSIDHNFILYNINEINFERVHIQVIFSINRSLNTFRFLRLLSTSLSILFFKFSSPNVRGFFCKLPNELRILFVLAAYKLFSWSFRLEVKIGFGALFMYYCSGVISSVFSCFFRIFLLFWVNDNPLSSICFAFFLNCKSFSSWMMSNLDKDKFPLNFFCYFWWNYLNCSLCSWIAFSIMMSTFYRNNLHIFLSV